MKASISILAALVSLFPTISYAESCGTPLECYEKAVKALAQARSEIEAVKGTAETALGEARSARAEAQGAQNSANAGRSEAQAAQNTANVALGETRTLSGIVYDIQERTKFISLSSGATTISNGLYIGFPQGIFVFQGDGNLVKYGAGMRALWQSGAGW